MILFPVFAIEQSETDLTSRPHPYLEDTSFVILGYYRGAMETSVSFVIKDFSGNRVYQSYAEASDDNNTGNNSKNIFTWTMSATTKKNKSVTLKFSFTILQAQLGDNYYKPTYTIKMKLNQTKDSNGNILNSDNFYNSGTNSQEKTLLLESGVNNATARKAGPSNSEFQVTSNQNYYIQYSGAVGNGTTTVSWVRSGYCTLNISDFEDEVAGSYDYTCTVTVEISTTT